MAFKTYFWRKSPSDQTHPPPLTSFLLDTVKYKPKSQKYNFRRNESYSFLHKQTTGTARIAPEWQLWCCHCWMTCCLPALPTRHQILTSVLAAINLTRVSLGSEMLIKSVAHKANSVNTTDILRRSGAAFKLSANSFKKVSTK